ncbi:MAG: zinc ribbon domain-containing protein [Campylobacterota bacterium]|nr:zinc ribbon domain-containing protein [Campylobacterota bacterium]
MNNHLQQLIDLAEIDKNIDAFEPQIEEANYSYEAALAKTQSISSSIESLTTEIKDEELKKSKNDLHLQELSQKLEENSKKSADVKTEREMKSLQLEEEIAKEQVTFANEEIARLEKIIESKKEQIETLETSLKDVSSNLEKVKSDVDAKLVTINADRQTVFVEKEKLLGDINKKGLAFYQKIRRWAKNTTVVTVEEQACMGCHMVISDKIYSDVVRAEEVTTCPHCGRILFVKVGEE